MQIEDGENEEDGDQSLNEPPHCNDKRVHIEDGEDEEDDGDQKMHRESQCLHSASPNDTILPPNNTEEDTMMAAAADEKKEKKNRDSKNVENKTAKGTSEKEHENETTRTR